MSKRYRRNGPEDLSSPDCDEEYLVGCMVKGEDMAWDHPMVPFLGMTRPGFFNIHMAKEFAIYQREKPWSGIQLMVAGEVLADWWREQDDPAQMVDWMGRLGSNSWSGGKSMEARRTCVLMLVIQISRSLGMARGRHRDKLRPLVDGLGEWAAGRGDSLGLSSLKSAAESVLSSAEETKPSDYSPFDGYGYNHAGTQLMNATRELADSVVDAADCASGYKPSESAEKSMNLACVSAARVVISAVRFGGHGQLNGALVPEMKAAANLIRANIPGCPVLIDGKLRMLQGDGMVKNRRRR